jgi:hypothetical protein
MLISFVSAKGQPVRPLTRYEASSIIAEAESNSPQKPTIFKAIALRKLKVQRVGTLFYLHGRLNELASQERGLAGVPEPNISTPRSQSTPLTPLPPSRASPTVNPTVVDALYSIKTTRYNNSFAARIYGNASREDCTKVIAMDWETRSPWMELMNDVIDHYSLAQYDFNALSVCQRG